jgi:hypothetical protein
MDREAAHRRDRQSVDRRSLYGCRSVLNARERGLPRALSMARSHRASNPAPTCSFATSSSLSGMRPPSSRARAAFEGSSSFSDSASDSRAARNSAACVHAAAGRARGRAGGRLEGRAAALPPSRGPLGSVRPASTVESHTTYLACRPDSPPCHPAPNLDLRHLGINAVDVRQRAPRGRNGAIQLGDLQLEDLVLPVSEKKRGGGRAARA